MPSLRPSSALLLSCFVLLVIWAQPSHAFGAGNIASAAKIEGQNWRHGDIEDTLLTLLMSRAAGGKKFSKMDVKRVYFGNWLRDYSQAVDVGTVKMVSAEAIRILLWILGFLTFGYGTKEFEVTRDRLGCYRPEEHIDNPKDYADNVDARQYDRRLRGPVDERRELSVDERTGLKNYIASEDLGITTSAGLVRNLFGRSIQLGRQYARSKNNADLYEALRLLGTGCHCLEDFSAHSNYTELALIEMGERQIFPHVGRRTQIQIRGARQPVYPLITGTFGGVDFLHSVMGELSDKTTQSEIQELEGTIAASQNQENKSMIKDLLNQLPSGLFGGKDEAGKADELQANAAAAQMQNTHITPRDPEAWTQQLNEISKQIYPILEFHDEIMQSVSETIENIPILPDLIEQLQDQINIFVFSLLAPFVLPVVKQVKAELATGSSEIIKSSRDKQLVVFHDDHSTDPTHSMLSKDHFTNVLNEPAGKVASQVLKWVVPQLIQCWDNEQIDPERTINRIVNGVFHHPALRGYGDDGASEGRQLMFQVVEQWWRGESERERDGLREQLSRQGVENGRNHVEGVHDTGHGSGKRLGMPHGRPTSSSGTIGGQAASAILGGVNQAMTGQPSKYGGRPSSGGNAFDEVGKVAGEAVGVGALGGIVGGLVGGVGATLLGNAFNKDDDETKAYKQQGYNQDGSYSTTLTETGHRPGGYGEQEKWGQAEYRKTEYPQGGHSEAYKRYEQDGRSGSAGYGFEHRVESRPTSGGGYEQTTERRYERPGGQWDSEVQRHGRTAEGETYSTETKHHGSKYDRDDSDDDDDYEKKERKRREKEEKRRKKEEKKYRKKGHHADSKDSEDDDSDDQRKRRSGGYGRMGDDDAYAPESHEERRHEGRQERHEGERQGYGGFGDDRIPGGFGEEPRHSGYGEERRRSGYGEDSRHGGYGEESQRQEYGRSSEGGRSQGYGEERRYGEAPSQEYGGRSRGDRDEREQSGYGAAEGYGGRERHGGDSGYGRGQDESQFGEQGMPGGFGGEDEHGERRQRYQGGSGYGQGREETQFGEQGMPGGFGGEDEGGERRQRYQGGGEEGGYGGGQDEYGGSRY